MKKFNIYSLHVGSNSKLFPLIKKFSRKNSNPTKHGLIFHHTIRAAIFSRTVSYWNFGKPVKSSVCGKSWCAYCMSLSCETYQLYTFIVSSVWFKFFKKNTLQNWFVSVSIIKFCDFLCFDKEQDEIVVTHYM